MEILDLQIARARVQLFTDESGCGLTPALPREQVACEALLNKGIQACKWLFRAEESYREGVGLGLIVNDPHVLQALESLYAAWLKSADIATSLWNALSLDGSAPGNLPEFCDCRDLVDERLQRLDWLRGAADAWDKQFAEEPW